MLLDYAWLGVPQPWSDLPEYLFVYNRRPLRSILRLRRIAPTTVTIMSDNYTQKHRETHPLSGQTAIGEHAICFAYLVLASCHALVLKIPLKTLDNISTAMCSRLC